MGRCAPPPPPPHYASTTGRRRAVGSAARRRGAAERRRKLEREFLDGVVRAQVLGECVGVDPGVDRQSGLIADIAVHPGDYPAALRDARVGGRERRQPVRGAGLHGAHVVEHVPVAEELVGVEVVRAAGVVAGEEVVAPRERDDGVMLLVSLAARSGREGMDERPVDLRPGVIGVPDHHLAGLGERVDRALRGRPTGRSTESRTGSRCRSVRARQW